MIFLFSFPSKAFERTFWLTGYQQIPHRQLGFCQYKGTVPRFTRLLHSLAEVLRNKSVIVNCYLNRFGGTDAKPADFSIGVHSWLCTLRRICKGMSLTSKGRAMKMIPAGGRYIGLCLGPASSSNTHIGLLSNCQSYCSVVTSRTVFRYDGD